MTYFVQKIYAATKVNQTPVILSDAQCHENSTIHRRLDLNMELKPKLEKLDIYSLK